MSSTTMLSNFADLGVAADLAASLAERGITAPFPIQAATIPPALAGQDVSGRAPTGSGKTLAFGIPLVERVEKARPRRPRALILVPTRELAAQIQRELTPLAALRKRTVAAFYGGVGFGHQLDALRRGVDIAVACPGRLGDLVKRGEVQLDDVDLVVVDEADRMADMGFLPEVRRLLDRVKPDRQTLLFSATLDGEVDVLVRRYQRNPARHEIDADQPTLDLTQHVFWKARREQRVDVTAQLIEHRGSTVVFCRTKHGADRLVRQLAQAGVTAAAIHGNRSQPQREKALAAFASRQVQALVATDVAARGIHVDLVNCVVHFDPPADEKDYVHRSGRTGRAGATGTVVSLVGDEHAATVRAMQRRLGMATVTHEPDLASLGEAVARWVRPARPQPARSQASSTRQANRWSTTGERPGPAGHRGNGSGRPRRPSRPVRAGRSGR